MSNLFRLAGFVCALALVATAAEVPLKPASLILDTDIGNDIDDVLALAMVHALESRGEARLLAVTISKDNRASATAVKALNEFYCRPSIPIGLVRNGVSKESSGMLDVLARRRASEDVPDAADVLKRTLENQPDQSVIVVQIGFSTNLARLVASEDGQALVKKKVRLLTLMAGNFVESRPEFNIETDLDSARALLDRWPTEMIFSGYEVGMGIQHPVASIQHDFGYKPKHPVVEAWMQFGRGDQNRPSYDETAVLQAIRPDRGYFDLSGRGTVVLDARGATHFTPDPSGKCRYMILRSDQVSTIQQLEADLVSQPPLPQPARLRPARCEKHKSKAH